MLQGKKVVGIIPARAGSKGVSDKNIKLLNGVPMIAYTINASIGSKYVDETFISTDSGKIAAVAERFGASVVKRPGKLATNKASSESALLHFAGKVDFDLLVFMQCTSPLTTAHDIDAALELFSSKKFDSLLSVCANNGGFLCGGFSWSGEGKPLNYDFRKRPLRQGMGKSYRENGAIYIMTRKGLLKSRNRLHGKIGLYEMPSERSFEVDSPRDFELLSGVFPVIKGSDASLFKEKIKKIKMVVFDVDGVFTDGSVYADSEGKESLRFSRIDGKGIELLRKQGVIAAVMSAEDDARVKKRMEKLGLPEIHIAVKDKLQCYDKLKEKYGLSDAAICFCADDVQDLEVAKAAGFSCCPANAQQQIKDVSDYVSGRDGGSGFVREICNAIIKAQEAGE